jgi:hypothetical protein
MSRRLCDLQLMLGLHNATTLSRFLARYFGQSLSTNNFRIRDLILRFSRYLRSTSRSIYLCSQTSSSNPKHERLVYGAFPAGFCRVSLASCTNLLTAQHPSQNPEIVLVTFTIIVHLLRIFSDVLDVGVGRTTICNGVYSVYEYKRCDKCIRGIWKR